MAVTDLKVSLRKKGATDFAGDGFRMLPITKKEYVLGLMGPDGKINPDLIPAWLYASRQQVGIADLVDANLGGKDIYDIFNDVDGFNMSTPPEVSDQGMYVEVTIPGELVNESPDAADFQIIGGGNEGNNTFPIELQTGDYIVLVKVSATTPKYSFAIVDNTYGDATTIAKGIVKLYDGVNNASSVLAATAGSVKTAYDLASGKEDAFNKNTAFNKNFGGNGSATTVSRSDHSHGTFDRASDVLVGGEVISDIVVSDGIVTSVATRALTPADLGTGAIDDGTIATNVVWSGSYLNNTFEQFEAVDISTAALAKKGLEYYTTVASADAGGHNAGDIVAVLEA